METDWSVNPHWFAKMEVDKDHEVGNGVPAEVEVLDELYYNMRFREDRENVLDLVTTIPTRERMRRYINLWNKHGEGQLGKKQPLMWARNPDPSEGGRGVGFFAPFHNERYFFPFRDILVSPIGIERFFSERGMRVIFSELKYVFLPCFIILVLFYFIKKANNNK